MATLGVSRAEHTDLFSHYVAYPQLIQHYMSTVPQFKKEIIRNREQTKSLN